MLEFGLTADELAVIDGEPEADEADDAGVGEPAGDAGARPGETAGPPPGEIEYHTRVIDAALPAIDRADLDLGGLALSELLAARDRALDR